VTPSKVIQRKALPFFVSALIGALAAAGCSGDKSAGGPPKMGPMPVTVLEMQPGKVPTSIEIMAQTEGARETEVRARVAGILIKRLYQEGEAVKAGQPLFQIDRAPYEIALSEARAKAEQTAREAARLKGLAEAKAIAQKDYDDAQSANAMAQAALRQAELNLSWTTVTAPVAGTTGRAIKSDGNLISTADSLLTSIYQTNPIWVRFSLGESDLAKFPAGRVTAKDVKGVELVKANGEKYEKPGKLNFLATNIDTTLGTQQLRAEFDNPGNQLLPGQFVRVRLLTGERDGVFLVPQSAVLQTEQGTLVMTAGPENKVTPRPVKAGEWYGKDWVILGGLNAGDKVIVDNLIKLRPGMPVDPKTPGQPPAMAGMGGMTTSAPAKQ
jgi:membrane fusion protein (multidrug efflux system)